ncbi:MAG: hypothetical protein VKN72_04785 [Nostocales cyanobacterium 94392]|nr:hypothetical protein [Nostocales cyanobacterium 94392]
MITDKKIKEWRKWGKEAYASTDKMMRFNHHHPDYQTQEQRDAIHDNFGDSYLLGEERKKVLLTKWEYTEEDYQKAITAFKDGYNASRKWYQKADKKFQAIIDKYTPIFKEAEELAKNVDVSNIKDGFPCGSAHLYLQDYPEAGELRKALGHFSSSYKTAPYKYMLPIKMPAYGQCITFDERVCQAVKEFLAKNGIFTSMYSWVD